MKKVSTKLMMIILTAILVSIFHLLTPVHAKEKTEIVIGTNLPMTGILAGAGLEQKWSYEQAVADINKKGGIYVKEYGKKLPVKLVIADDESNAGKAGKAVERLIKHEMYGKYIRRTTKILAHDEQNECRVGDTVEIAECRPISRRKSWRVVNVVGRAEAE